MQKMELPILGSRSSKELVLKSSCPAFFLSRFLMWRRIQHIWRYSAFSIPIKYEMLAET
jgi:hypothetical protein